MKDGYKLCPYCANEIKEIAIKCQFCHELLNEKNKNNTDIGKNTYTFSNIKKEIEYDKPRYKHLWIWIIIGFFLIIIAYNINYKIEKRNAKNTINNYYNAVIKNNGEIDDSMDFSELLDANKTIFDNIYYQEIFEKIGKIREKFDENLNLIGDLYIEDNRDFKNISLLRDIISNWKLYKSAYNEYSQDTLNLVKEIYDKFGRDSSENIYSLNGASEQISQFAKITEKRADINIELYSYILTIQNDFYVDEDGNVLFYEGGDKMNKYNNLMDKREKEGDIYDKEYNKMTEYNYEYAKNFKENFSNYK